MAQFNADGTPDTSFGTDGSALIAAPGLQTSEIAVDGQQVVLAGTFDEGNPLDEVLRIGVARLTTSGQLDPSFGTAGVTMLTANTAAKPDQYTGERAVGVEVNAVGQVYVVGQANQSPGAEVYRLGTSGLPDPSFGTDGVSVLPASTLAGSPSPRSNPTASSSSPAMWPITRWWPGSTPPAPWTPRRPSPRPRSW